MLCSSHRSRLGDVWERNGRRGGPATSETWRTKVEDSICRGIHPMRDESLLPQTTPGQGCDVEIPIRGRVFFYQACDTPGLVNGRSWAFAACVEPGEEKNFPVIYSGGVFGVGGATRLGGGESDTLFLELLLPVGSDMASSVGGGLYDVVSQRSVKSDMFDAGKPQGGRNPSYAMRTGGELSYGLGERSNRGHLLQEIREALGYWMLTCSETHLFLREGPPDIITQPSERWKLVRSP
ncbi:uncharacterized protein EI90DRAFT_3286750 [Cantharellus anzutake]|uniref:uncharacterized protein n=1 Tax=Cantharellus anzutake TaxID=1750568 RepID=UPI001907611C|nr:uncharacterized protein EI90DRAFT_3286750 [Cantharellus anzutake]KAF8337971.1 hypothetical protein EI90DRAFT_3286750 [Cantharellus anzutake]